ncbi:MAG: hypothetical protein ACLFQK_05125 [Fibrobacterota bacterium]
MCDNCGKHILNRKDLIRIEENSKLRFCSECYSAYVHGKNRYKAEMAEKLTAKI